jgi:hypothetical protein
MTGLGILIIIICFVAFFRNRTARREQDVNDKFWERENLANSTVKQSLDNLSYITIPLDNFPIGICDDSKIKEQEALLASLARQKIVDLDAYSNTDLKLMYGAGNLDTLKEYGENYDSMCRIIADYGNALIDAGHSDDAVAVLQFGISSGSDISRNFILLGQIYRSSGDVNKFNELLDTARGLNSPMRDSIVRKLEEM